MRTLNWRERIAAARCEAYWAHRAAIVWRIVSKGIEKKLIEQVEGARR